MEVVRGRRRIRSKRCRSNGRRTRGRREKSRKRRASAPTKVFGVRQAGGLKTRQFAESPFAVN